MSKTNIVKYNFTKIEEIYIGKNYSDDINNFSYYVCHLEKPDEICIIIKSLSKGMTGEIYLDQFIEFYNELPENLNYQINELDTLTICNGKNINLDYIKIKVKRLNIGDNVTILPFEKHFDDINFIFGSSKYQDNMNREVSTIKTTFVSNVRKIRPQNYDKLFFTHYFGDFKSYYIYCELDHLLCKFRDDMNLKNVTICNVNNGINFEYEDFLNENPKFEEGFKTFFE